VYLSDDEGWNVGGMLVVRILVALLGVVLIAVGFFLWSAPAGFIVSGVLSLLVTYVWQYMAVGMTDEVS
jgi:hypothetical protein